MFQGCRNILMPVHLCLLFVILQAVWRSTRPAASQTATLLPSLQNKTSVPLHHYLPFLQSLAACFSGCLKLIYVFLKQRLDSWLLWIQGAFAGYILSTATFKYKTYFSERDLLIVSHTTFQELSLDFLFAVNLCSNPEDKLQIYRDNFEKAYLDSTERFYRTQAPSYLQQNGVQNYMKYVSKNSAVIFFWKCWCLKWWLFYFCTGRC